MRYIDEAKINDLLRAGVEAGARVPGIFTGSPAPTNIDAILAKSGNLKRLSLEEAAILLAVNDKYNLNKIFTAASKVKDTIYGRRMVIFAPLYISNVCSNACLYCAFKQDNKLTKRIKLDSAQIKTQTQWLLKQGHKRILMVAGEYQTPGKSLVDYYVESVQAIYAASFGVNKIRRVNINCAPLTVDEFKKLKKSGIGTYQIFQETYHQETYLKMHPVGPKNDPDNRLEAVNRAILAGIDDVGIGVLYGLYDYRFETLALLAHIEYLEKKFNIGPHTISVPRLEPALGTNFTPPYPVSDLEFKKIVAVLRLAVPYTGLILSTREPAQLRNQLFNLGISQISAGSSTSPGGYGENKSNKKSAKDQFSISDKRSLDQVIYALIKGNFIPSFCAACYRKERTGQVFMNLAKPGAIKDKCSINALVTFQEYLQDFSSAKVKKIGQKLVKNFSYGLADKDKKILQNFLQNIARGKRDEYI